jgi:hypothetical protein
LLPIHRLHIQKRSFYWKSLIPPSKKMFLWLNHLYTLNAKRIKSATTNCSAWHVLYKTQNWLSSCHPVWHVKKKSYQQFTILNWIMENHAAVQRK